MKDGDWIKVTSANALLETRRRELKEDKKIAADNNKNNTEAICHARRELVIPLKEMHEVLRNPDVQEFLGSDIELWVEIWDLPLVGANCGGRNGDFADFGNPDPRLIRVSLLTVLLMTPTW